MHSRRSARRPLSSSPEELRELLRSLAARLIWWQAAVQSLRHPDRVVAQVLQRAEPS